MRKNTLVITGCVVFLIIVAMLIVPYAKEKKQEKERLAQFNEATEICSNVAKKHGLTDAYIEISDKNNIVTLFAKGLDTLSYDDIVCIYDEINDELFPHLYFNSIANRYKIRPDEGQTKVYEHGTLVYTAGKKRNTADVFNTTTSDLSGEEKGYAWAVAIYEIENRLKSPATAKFPTYNDANITRSASNFTVVGYVDAENSYGAMLRTSFTVTFKRINEDSYELISVDIKE